MSFRATDIGCGPARRYRRWRLGAALAAALVTGSALVVVTGPAAFAAGGYSVALAPMVTPGALYTGNTAKNTVGSGVDIPGGPKTLGIQCSFQDVEYWTLNLTVSDEVVITGAVVTPASGLAAALFPPGTKDENIDIIGPVASWWLDTPLRFVANATGQYPLAIGPCAGPHSAADGPFSFTVNIIHAADMYVRPQCYHRGQGNTDSVCPRDRRHLAEHHRAGGPAVGPLEGRPAGPAQRPLPAARIPLGRRGYL